MAEIPSKQFRKIYPTLTEVTQVTSYGRLLGTWTPANLVAVEQPKFIQLPVNASRTEVKAIQAQNSSVPPYDWSDDFGGTPTGLNPSDFTPVPQAKIAAPKVHTVPNSSFGRSQPAPKPGKKR